MGDKRQNNQLRLAFGEETRSEAPQSSGEGSQGCSLVFSSIRPNRRMRTRMSGGVGGEER